MAKNDGKGLKRIIAIIISLIIVIITGTFAWLTWRSQNTAMVLTIGEINGLKVTLTPYQINRTLSPVPSYSDGVVANVTAQNQKNVEDNFNLFYQIDSIDSALIDQDFKYTITKCTANCNTPSNYTVLTNASGNFSGASANSNLTIYQETVPANTTFKYKVYLWIDSAGGNQSNMQNKTFVGELRASIPKSVYTVNLYDEYATGYNSVWLGQSIPSGITPYNTPETAMAALKTAGGGTTDYPFFLKHTVGNYSGYCAYEKANGIDTGYHYCLSGMTTQSECNNYFSGWDWEDNGTNYTYVCTQTSQNNAVTDSYVGFVVTSTMAANNTGMTAGTYYIKGGDNGSSFLANAKIIYDAFGGVGCYSDGTAISTPYSASYNPNPSSDFICGVPGLYARAHSDGYVDASGDAGPGCDVDDGGGSSCWLDAY